MSNPTSSDQPVKPSRKRRRVLFLLLPLILVMIGFGTLQVFQVPELDGANENTSNEASAALSENPVSSADSDIEETQNSSLSATKKINSETEHLDTINEERELNESPDQQQAELVISGAVLDDTGMLLPGIPVTARVTNRVGLDEDAIQKSGGVFRQQTDRLGSFTFTKLVQGEYELAIAAHEQYHPATLRVRAGTENAEIMLQRIRSVRVYGSVTDDVGNPLEGVQVRALGNKIQVSSDISGNYEIQTGPSKAGQAPVLDFSLEEYQDSRHRVEGALNPDTEEVQLDVELVWEPNLSKVTVSGQVIGPTGEPVVGARLWLSSSEFQAYETTRSNSLGGYQFKNVKVGNAYTLGVEPQDEYAAFKSDLLSIGPGDFEYDMTLEATRFSDLSGIVTDLDGTPLRNFSLWARSMDMGRHPLMPVRTDGAGQFQLEQIPSGAIKLESRSQPWLEVTGIILTPGESRHVQVPLDWGQNWLLGQVVDDQGIPIARAQLVLRWAQNFMGINSESRREIMTDLEGYFAVSNLDADEYTVTVQAAGYESSRVQYRRSQEQQEMRITLLRSGS